MGKAGDLKPLYLVLVSVGYDTARGRAVAHDGEILWRQFSSNSKFFWQDVAALTPIREEKIREKYPDGWILVKVRKDEPLYAYIEILNEQFMKNEMGNQTLSERVFSILDSRGHVKVSSARQYLHDMIMTVIRWELEDLTDEEDE